MEDSYDTQIKEKLELEKVLKEIAPTGYDLLKRCRKAWHDQKAMQQYVKLNSEFKNIRGLVEEDLSSILVELGAIETLIGDGEYEVCEKTLKEVQDKYNQILKIIKDKEEALNLPEKIRIENLESGLTLYKEIRYYENQLASASRKDINHLEDQVEIANKFEKLIDFAEKYKNAREAGKKTKYTPNQIVNHIQQKLDEYADFSDNMRYKTLSKLKDEIADLPLIVEEVEEIPENNNHKKKKLKKKTKKKNPKKR